MQFKFNDGGRALAGYKGNTGDCVCRAICIVTGKPYQEVYDVLAKGNKDQKLSKAQMLKIKAAGKHGGEYLKRKMKIKTAAQGINVKRKWFQDYIESLGLIWIPTMHIGQGCKVHLIEHELPTGKLIVVVSKHYTAVIDGVIHDTHDCSRNGTRCVYGYYTY